MKASAADTITLTIRLTLRQVDGRWHVAGDVIEPYHDGWPDEPEAFGHAIRLARLREGINVDEFAHMVGVAPGTIRNIETGRNPPTRATRAWIVTALAKLGQAPESETTEAKGETENVPE